MLELHMHPVHTTGMKLSDYLSKREITDADFAKEVGMSQSQVNRLRRGVSKPNWATVDLIEQKTDKAVTASDWASPAQAVA